MTETDSVNSPVVAPAGRTLPAGWVWSTLGEITKINPGVDINEITEETLVSFVPMAAVEAISGKMDSTSARPLREVRRGFTAFQTGDVLFAKITPSMENGKSAVARKLISGIGFGSTEFHVLRPEVGIEANLIRYYLSQEQFRREARSKMTGTAGQMRVPTAFIDNHPFPLAPQNEQKRIATKLDELFSQLDSALEALQAARARVKAYRMTSLTAAISGVLSASWREESRAANETPEDAQGLLACILGEHRTHWEEEQRAKHAAKTKSQKKLLDDESWKTKYPTPAAPDTRTLPDLPNGWCWATIEQLAAPEANAITDGPFGSNLKSEHYTITGPRVIRLQNIGDGIFRDEYAHISSEHFERLHRHEIFAGNLVIAALGERPPRSCIVPEAVGRAVVKADCIKFKTSPHISAKYVNFVLNAETTRERATKLLHGVGRPRLNLGEIKSIAIPLPPRAEQEYIVAEVEERLTVAAQGEAALDANEKRVKALRQSILKRAFTGELVPPNPDDEPAGVLLECIRNARIVAQIQAKKEQQRRRPRQKQKTMKTSKQRKPLADTLNEAEGPLTPEELFTAAGFTWETVDEFYAELREHIGQSIAQERPNETDVYLMTQKTMASTTNTTGGETHEN